MKYSFTLPPRFGEVKSMKFTFQPRESAVSLAAAMAMLEQTTEALDRVLDMVPSLLNCYTDDEEAREIEGIQDKAQALMKEYKAAKETDE